LGIKKFDRTRIDQVGFLSWLFGLNHKQAKIHTPRNNHFVRIGYIVHDSKTMDCNGDPRKIFMSIKNSHGYARYLSKREKRTIYVFEVDLDDYSLGTGDSPKSSCMYGVFRGWNFKGYFSTSLIFTLSEESFNYSYFK
jgi:hypothetical protein